MIVWGGGFSVKKQQNLEIISFHFMIIWDFYGSSAKKIQPWNIGLNPRIFPATNNKTPWAFWPTFREGHFAVPRGVGALRRFVGLSVGQRVAFPAIFLGPANKNPGGKTKFLGQTIYIQT